MDRRGGVSSVGDGETFEKKVEGDEGTTTVETWEQKV